MIELLVLVVLLMVGYGFGRANEARHYASIRERELRYRDVLLFSARFPPEAARPRESRLVMGNAVVSVDFFKQFVAGLRSLLGGRVTSYESLLDRARREAVLRMKEDAALSGARAIFNVKFETSSISQGAKNSIGSVEVLAYGTALAD
jgi:uncharacterized protein YbjQ (UPF0145 family)